MQIRINNRFTWRLLVLTLFTAVSLWSIEAMACGQTSAGAAEGEKVPKCRGVETKPPAKRMLPRKFTSDDIKALCSAIEQGSAAAIHQQMDEMIAKAEISKQEWNSFHAFRIRCSGNVPLEYALARGFERFKAVADYGVDLGREFPDGEGGTSTLKDYATHIVTNKKSSAAEKKRWQGILNYLTEHKAKGCADQSELFCMTRHVWASPLKPKNTFDAAIQLAHYSLALRQLKWSNCTNKVTIDERADTDLLLIEQHLSEEENQRFAESIMAIKERSGEDMKYKISEHKRINGSVDLICSTLENDYKKRYNTAKAAFMSLAGAVE